VPLMSDRFSGAMRVRSLSKVSAAGAVMIRKNR
jgi:hypothetical protein